MTMEPSVFLSHKVLANQSEWLISINLENNNCANQIAVCFNGFGLGIVRTIVRTMDRPWQCSLLM